MPSQENSPGAGALPIAGVLLLLVLCAAGLAALALAVPDSREPVVLFGVDALCQPSRVVRLEARVYAPGRGKGINPGVEGIAVTLYRGKQPIQHRRTSRFGCAVFYTLSPARAGMYPYSVEIAGPYPATRVPLTLQVRPAFQSFVLFDVDGALARHESSPPLASDTPARDGGAPAVSRRADRLGFLYLSSAHEIHTARYRAWLRKNGYPPGTLVLRDDTLTRLSAGEFFKLRMDEIKYFWPMNWVAVGNDAQDARAFQASLVRGIILTPGGRTKLPAGIEQVRTLEEAMNLMENSREDNRR